MRVFLTGGTGAIGGYAVPALVRAGHSVWALARSDAKADMLRAQGTTPVRVSLFNRDALAAAFENDDAVINLASALPSTARFIFRSAWRECDHVPLLGLPPLPVADLPEAPLEDPIGTLHWKTAALVAAAAGRRFVWLDDEIADIDRAWVGAHHGGSALLHRVDPRSGLTEADLAVVGDWLGRSRTDRHRPTKG